MTRDLDGEDEAFLALADPRMMSVTWDDAVVKRNKLSLLRERDDL